MTGTVLITGASRGIGEACALRLVRSGRRVFAGVRDAAHGDALQRAGGPGITPVRLDVTDATSIEAAQALVAEQVGARGLDALVNNAGIAVGGPLELLTADDLRQQLEVNVVGQQAVTRAFLPLLRRAHGRIVFMSSIAGRSALPIMGAYGASKHALEAMADALRVELRPWDIAVTLIEPAVIATEIWDRSISATQARLERVDPAALERYGRVIDAVRRRAERGMGGLPPDDVARAVERALTARHPRARYILGRGARTRILLETLLPTRLRDRIVARALEKL